jgi:hypothetical protein
MMIHVLIFLGKATDFQVSFLDFLFININILIVVPSIFVFSVAR